MNNTAKMAGKADDELMDVLLDFIIVSASLAKNIHTVIRSRHYLEGGHKHEAVRGKSGYRRAYCDA